MSEVNEAAQIISQASDPDANIIFGATVKEDQLDTIRISVIATGFDDTRAKLREFAGSGMRMGGALGGNMPGVGQQPQTAWGDTSAVSASDDSNQMQNPQQTDPSEEEISEQKVEEEDEDDLEIPAFLRSNR